MNANKENETKPCTISGVSGLFKLRRYASGFIIGICLNYVYSADTPPYWYLALGIAILQIAVMIVDCLPDDR